MGTEKSHGTFPFGRPNSERPMRVPASGEAKALVVGVYPSALHIAWSPPVELDERDAQLRKRRAYISSLAVDVEPVVFWDGKEPTPASELERWKSHVGFDESCGVANLGNNGPSGAGVVKDVLGLLGLDAAHVAFTDAVPWFFVKKGTGSQGDAIEKRFAPLAPKLNGSDGVHAGDLPKRPSQKDLVEIVGSERRAGLRSEIADASAPTIITLGQEALDAVRVVADAHSGLPEKLASERYGRLGGVTVDVKEYALLPLVHPGFRRQLRTQNPPPSHQAWKVALDAWATTAGDLLA